MYRFFVENINDSSGYIDITGDDVNHIRNVLRLQKDETIYISNGNSRDYKCVIEELDNEYVRVRIIDILDSYAELPIEITLFQGVPKGDKMELIVQKAVELGARRVVPVIMDRTISRPDEKKMHKKTERYQKIAESAAKQSRRGMIPEVKDFISFDKAMEMAETMDVILTPYESADGMSYAAKVINDISTSGVKTLGIFIGPEGGISDREIEILKDKGSRIITLGHRILRTETAGLAILSILMFNIESNNSQND